MITKPPVTLFNYYTIERDENIYEVIGYDNGTLIIMSSSENIEVEANENELKPYWLQKGQIFTMWRGDDADPLLAKLINIYWDEDALAYMALLEPGGSHLLSDLKNLELL